MKRGFALPEVMIALFLLSTSVFLFSELQVKAMLRVWSGRQEIDRVYSVKKFLYKQFLSPKKAKRARHSFEDPDMKITLTPKNIAKKSALHEYKDYLSLLSAEAEWDSGGKKKRLALITCAPFDPQEDEV